MKRRRFSSYPKKPEDRLTQSRRAASLPKVAVAVRQREHANRLHSLFQRVELATQQGRTFAASVRSFVTRWRGKPYRTDPTRKTHFTLITLRRLHRQWQRGGCVASALLPRYRSTGPAVPLWVYLKFLKLVSRVDFPTMRAAHAEFCRRGGWFGSGRPPSKPGVPLSYGQLLYYFPARLFLSLQDSRRALATAHQQFADSQLGADALLRANVPARAQRKRRTGAELSMEGAKL